MTTETLKSEGRYRTAGQLAALRGEPKAYGCHFGMRSERAYAISQFNAGYEEIENLFA